MNLPVENLNLFIKTFEPRFEGSSRWEAFQFIARNLINRDRPINILETGVSFGMDWKGYGCSTQVWTWLTDNLGGLCRSVDIDADHVNRGVSVAPHAAIILGDSIKVLSELDLSKVDLLYLDSYDHNPPYALSELHAVGELAASYERLPSGCLIGVDDCKSENSGKHNFVKAFFNRLGVAPKVKGYVYIWEKP